MIKIICNNNAEKHMNLIKFSKIISSRLCHDLISPAGALSSGLELLEEDMTSSSEVFELIKRSSSSLNKRLVFYRAAWGELSFSTKSLNDLLGIIQSYCQTYNVQFIMDESHFLSAVNDDPTIFSGYAKVLLCGTSLIKDILPQGGILRLQFLDYPEGKSLVFVFEGRLYNLKDEMIQILVDDFDESLITTKTIHCLLLRLYVSEINLMLNINGSNDTKLVINATKQNLIEEKG